MLDLISRVLMFPMGRDDMGVATWCCRLSPSVTVLLGGALSCSSWSRPRIPAVAAPCMVVSSEDLQFELVLADLRGKLFK